MDSEYSLLQYYFSRSKDFKFTSHEMNREICFLECLNQGPNIKFYGIKNGIDCYCGEKLSFHGKSNGYEVPRSACNIPCPGDSTQERVLCRHLKQLDDLLKIRFCLGPAGGFALRFFGEFGF